MLNRWRRSSERTAPRTPYGNLIAYMRRRLEAQPADLRLHLSLVTHLRMAGRYEEAIEEANRIVRMHPDHRRAKGLLLRLKLEQRLAGIQRSTAIQRLTS